MSTFHQAMGEVGNFTHLCDLMSLLVCSRKTVHGLATSQCIVEVVVGAVSDGAWSWWCCEILLFAMLQVNISIVGN